MEHSVNERTRVQLRSIAAPSILGLNAFAGCTLIVAAELARWYGGFPTRPRGSLSENTASRRFCE